MKLVMTLMVRDEADIIRSNILYHLDRGVDFIIATDNLSRDATPDILQEFESAGVLHLIHERGDNFEKSRWVTRMARLAWSRYGADWVINNDADEFWWPETGNLKDVLSAVPDEYTGVEVQRSNFIPRPGSHCSPIERMIVRDLRQTNALGSPLPPKVCHRGMADVITDQGNHTLLAPTGVKLFLSAALQIFHYPLRSPDQMVRKVVNAGAAYERNTDAPPGTGDVLRKLYADHKAGALLHHWHRQCLDEAALTHGVRTGTLQRDTRLRNYMRAKALSH